MIAWKLEWRLDFPKSPGELHNAIEIGRMGCMFALTCDIGTSGVVANHTSTNMTERNNMPRRSRSIVFLAAALTSAISTFAADSEQTTVDVQRAQKAGEVLPQEQIIQRAKAQHPGNVTEIELDHERGRYVYEVDITDDAGTKTEMKFDAKTGELISKEVDHDDEEESAEEDN